MVIACVYNYAGEILIIEIEIDEEIDATNLTMAQILNSSGAPLTSLELLSAGGGVYFNAVELPPESSQVLVLGVDSKGYPLSRIGGAGVFTTDVEIEFGEASCAYNDSVYINIYVMLA